MLIEVAEKKITDSDLSARIVVRLTALWALNESALGGVLLAFKIPFTGLFIGSAAVLIISLLAFFDNKPGTIMRATVIVMIIKGLVSPHTPVTSYAAVLLQGVLGEIFFRYFSWRSAAFILSCLALLLSAMQKFLIITLIFGMNIWDSIDLFGNYIIKLFLPAHQSSLSLPISFSLIIIYSMIHLFAGFIVGLFIPKVAYRVRTDLASGEYRNLFPDTLPENGELPPKKRRRFFKKGSAYILFIIITSIVLLSYIFPVFEKSRGYAVVMMVLRSVVIMGLWYFVLGPVVLKRLKSFLAQKEHTYSGEIKSILYLFPVLRRIVKFSWRQTASERKFKRPVAFLINLLVISINADLSALYDE